MLTRNSARKRSVRERVPVSPPVPPLHRTPTYQISSEPPSSSHVDGGGEMMGNESIREISVGYRILNLSNIDDQAGTIDAEIMFFFSWIDPALRNYISIGGESTADLTRNQPNWDNVWSPVLMCPNVRKSIGVDAVHRPRDRSVLIADRHQQALEDNLRHGGLGYRQDLPFLVDPIAGRVVLEKRLSYRFGTNFELQDFPFDGQSLEIVIIELEHPRGIRFVPVSSPYAERNTISSFAKKNLHNWALHYPTERFDAASAYIANNPAQYTLQINLRRRSTFYIWYVMFPFSIICCSALLGFALPPDSLNDRLPAVIGSIFTAVTFHLSAASSSLPSVPYITYMGSFILTGFIIMFVVAMYYAIVFSWYSGDEQKNVDNLAYEIARGVLVLYFCAFAIKGFQLRHTTIKRLQSSDLQWRGQNTLQAL